MWQITGRLNLEPHSANYAHFTWEASDSGTNIEKLRRRIKLVDYTIYGTLSSMWQKWINKFSEQYLADIVMKRITTKKHAKYSSWVYHCIPAPPSHKFNWFQQPIASDTSLCQAIHLAYVRATVLLTIWPTPCNELPLSTYKQNIDFLSFHFKSLFLSFSLITAELVYFDSHWEITEKSKLLSITDLDTTSKLPFEWHMILNLSTQNIFQMIACKKKWQQKGGERHTWIHPVSRACHRHPFAVDHWEPGMPPQAPAPPFL